MSASVEALAFAGVDCNQVTIGFDSLEDDYIPPYLLAKNYENYSMSEEKGFFFASDAQWESGSSFDQQSHDLRKIKVW